MGASVAFWGDDPGVWDACFVNGVQLPGICRVTVKRPSRLDVRKPPKFHKAVLVDQGQAPASGTIEMVLGFNSTGSQPYGTAADQWNTWLAILDSIFGRKAKTRDAFSVSHPEFQLAGISKVYLEDPGSLEGSGPGVRKITIPWYEEGKIYPAETGTGTGGSVGVVKPKHNPRDAVVKPSAGVTP